MSIPGPALFDFRQIRYTFAHKPGAILKCGRLMLGASPTDVLRAAKAEGATISRARYTIIENDLDGRNTAAVEWWVLCRCLELCADWFRDGYGARWHLTKVRGAVERGEYRLPMSSILETRLRAFDAWEESWREQWCARPGLTFKLNSERSVSVLDQQD